MSALRHKPLMGGPFGTGRFALASVPSVARGLHAAEYLVVETQSGCVIAKADQKEDVLREARRVLRDVGEAEDVKRGLQQGKLFDEHELPLPEPCMRVGPISRRRREVYGRNHGRCFYCRTPLSLREPWHIEHQLPRALDGDDRPLNLVMACPGCNSSKGDLTALEHIVSQSRAATG